MKRLSEAKIMEAYKNCLLHLDDYWNDVEIVIDGRFEAQYFNTPGEAMNFWRNCNEPYKRVAVKKNHIDEHGDIIDISREFEYELGY